MKITVLGGTGLVGAKVASRLWDLGHEVVAAAYSTGVNSITGEGLDGALSGAQGVVDVTNAPSTNGEEAMAFFTTSTRNLGDAERRAGVGHHVALSVVGVGRPSESGYLKARTTQERMIRDSGVPYTI